MVSDTDVFVLLMDMAARGHFREFTTLRLLSGRGAKYRAIDVQEQVSIIGTAKSKGLIGFHNFTGSDWGGKFVGVSKKTWVLAYLSLAPDDEIVQKC